MILAVLPDDRDIAFEKGRFTVAVGTVPNALERPVKAVRAVERVEADGPVHERVTVTVEPGTAEHARAALLAIGARTLIDDEA